MKIVHICLEAPYLDGWSYQENMLPKHHADLGHEVTVIGSRNQFPYYIRDKVNFLDCAEPYLDGAVRVIRLWCARSIAGKFHHYSDLPTRLAELAPDLIYHHGGQSLSLLDSSKHVEAHPNSQLFVDFHSEYYNTATNWISRAFLHKLAWRTIIRKCLPSIGQIYCISPGAKKLCQELYALPAERMDYLYLGIEDRILEESLRQQIRGEVRKELGLSDNAFLVVTGGKLNQEKRIEVAVNAVRALGREDVHLAIFGAPDPGEESYSEQLVNGAPRTHLLGWCNSAAITRYYQAADLAVFPGGQSVLWQEAIATGLPCVFRRWPGNEYVVHDNAYFVYTDREEELLQWLKVLSQPGSRHLLDAMRASATAMVRGDMSYRVEAQRIIDRFLALTTP